MPRSGSGIYTLPPVYVAVPGTTVRSEQHNAPLEDLADAMTGSLPRNGAAPMTGNLNMNGRKIVNLLAATAPGDAPRFDQVPTLGAYLSSVSQLTFAADRISYATGAGTAGLAALTAFGRSLIAGANAAAGRTTLGFTIVDPARDVMNAAVAHEYSDWLAGTSAVPGFPTPVQVRGGALGSSLAGIGQTWQNVSGARNFGVTYTNSTGRPIKFNIEVLTDNGTLAISVGGVQTQLHQHTGLNRYTVSEIVPPGQTYSVTGTASQQSWVELR